MVSARRIDWHTRSHILDVIGGISDTGIGIGTTLMAGG